MAKTKEEKSKYDQEFQKTHMKHISIWFNREKDKDIIDRLESQPDTTSAYIKQLIRYDIAAFNSGTGRYSK